MKNFVWGNSHLKLGSSELMALVANNDDHKAFEALYQQLSHKLYQFIYYIVLDESRAQELTHEAFLTLYDKRKQYRKEYQVTTWLWTIARNKSYDHMKKAKELNIQDEEIITSLEDEHISALEKLIEEANSNLVSAAMAQLPEMQREAITLWMNGHSGDEISQILDRSKQAVKNLINRAKVKLKEILEEELGSL